MTVVVAAGESIGSRSRRRHASRALAGPAGKNQTVAIAGAGELARDLARRMRRKPELGLELLGLYADRRAGETRRAEKGDVPVCGDLHALLDLCRAGAVSRVYLALPAQEAGALRDLVEKLADTPVAAHLALGAGGVGLLSGREDDPDDLCSVSLFETRIRGLAAVVKRAVDVAFASLVLGVTAVPMVLVALGVRLSCGRPVFSRQRRYGLDGREIRVWKFRTTRTAPDCEDAVRDADATARVTRFGAFLRRTCLDELPQFVNVLQGSLSIVGPRSHSVAHNQAYRRRIPLYMLRHRVKPGITGWSQVNGLRGEPDDLRKMEERVSHDLWYIRNWTPWLDLRIVARTTFQVSRDVIRRLARGPAKGGGAAPSVLLLVENLPVPLDRRVWREALSLRDRGYRVSVVCPKMYGHRKGYERLEGVDVFRFHLPFESSGGLLGHALEYATALLLTLLYALRVWARSGLDVLHVANPPDLLMLVALPFKLLGKRVIYDQHDVCPELLAAKGGGRTLYRVSLLLERMAYRLANAVIVPNNSYRQIALRRGGDAERPVFVVRNAPLCGDLDTGDSAPLEPLVGYVGVMGAQDSVDVVLEVAAALKGSHPELRYVLLGDGTHRAWYERRAEELGVRDRVRFTGIVDEERKASELGRARICVVPDRVNEFTALSTMTKVMEYMAMGKPIVQFDTPEGRYSAGSASLYARRNDVEDFARKVAELVDEPERAMRLGRAGRERFLRRLHWGRSVKGLYSAYDSVLGTRKPAPSWFFDETGMEQA